MTNGCDKKNINMLNLYREIGLEGHYMKLENYKNRLALAREFEKKDYFVTAGQIHAVKVAEFIMFCNSIKKKRSSN